MLQDGLLLIYISFSHCLSSHHFEFHIFVCVEEKKGLIFLIVVVCTTFIRTIVPNFIGWRNICVQVLYVWSNSAAMSFFKYVLLQSCRKYISCLRPERKGKVGAVLDTIGTHHIFVHTKLFYQREQFYIAEICWFIAEFLWRCILKKQVEKSLAVILGFMSFAILLAEATMLPSGVDLSLFSILVHAAGEKEVLVQVIFVDLSVKATHFS